MAWTLSSFKALCCIVWITEEEACDTNYSERARLIQKDPITCALHFDQRFKALKRARSNKKGPLNNYQVSHHYNRFEFQLRGSTHVHMLIWLKNAPMFDPLIRLKRECLRIYGWTNHYFNRKSSWRSQKFSNSQASGKVKQMIPADLEFLICRWRRQRYFLFRSLKIILLKRFDNSPKFTRGSSKNERKRILRRKQWRIPVYFEDFSSRIY